MTTQELFFKLLKYKSITPNDDGAFFFIADYLSQYKHTIIDIEDTKNLFLYKKFGEGPHLCFAGHIDVVPPGDGWSSDPFEPTIRDGKVYARGTQDMKSGVCAFLQVFKQIKEFNGTLSIILTSDEEGDAEHGTIEVLRHLKKIDFLPDYAIVAEPTCEKVFGDAIKIGRRGSINGVLNIEGLQGHAAYPEKGINPVNLIAPILDKIAAHNFDEGDENFAPSELVVTDIRAGMEVTNVTPGNLKMMFNVRNSTNTKKEDIQKYIENMCEGLNFSLTLSQSSFPFVTSSETLIVKLLQNAIEEITTCRPKLSTAGGTSDARFLAEFGIKTVEFGVINDTIHAPNERCGMDEVEKLEKVFLHVIKKF
ncbi:succinyl-diaminopimelate desuccinylase [Sulfurospirillum arcachonense]|uniref:succinyl-diaminopimelate desuccinylase n=1 Tax=Sulfurospirillum arcachonense TaxID=57666 RepID=UPI000469E40E|nr:succinyl-diaminopimelate desuccinylase [Sulfurospirillum arcachonense]